MKLELADLALKGLSTIEKTHGETGESIRLMLINIQ